jgi:hypothetical protein
VGSLFTRRPGPFLPSWSIDAEREQPHDQRGCPKEAEDREVVEETIAERRVQESQPTHAGEFRPHAQKSRQEDGPEYEPARQKCIESEKCQADRGTLIGCSVAPNVAPKIQ